MNKTRCISRHTGWLFDKPPPFSDGLPEPREDSPLYLKENVGSITDNNLLVMEHVNVEQGQG